LRTIEFQNESKIRESLGASSRRLNMYFSTPKFKKLQEKNYGPWKLMNWVKKHKLPAIEVIQYNSWPCLEFNDLQQTLHLLFNLVQNCQINLDLLEGIPNKSVTKWMLFSEEEIKSSIIKFFNSWSWQIILEISQSYYQ